MSMEDVSPSTKEMLAWRLESAILMADRKFYQWGLTESSFVLVSLKLQRETRKYFLYSYYIGAEL